MISCFKGDTIVVNGEDKVITYMFKGLSTDPKPCWFKARIDPDYTNNGTFAKDASYSSLWSYGASYDKTKLRSSKPKVVPNGSTFYEIDTLKTYMFAQKNKTTDTDIYVTPGEWYLQGVDITLS